VLTSLPNVGTAAAGGLIPVTPLASILTLAAGD
jgi:hypothetical protein